MSLPEELTRGRKGFNMTSFDAETIPKRDSRPTKSGAERCEVRRRIEERQEHRKLMKELEGF